MEEEVRNGRGDGPVRFQTAVTLVRQTEMGGELCVLLVLKDMLFTN